MDEQELISRYNLNNRDIMDALSDHVVSLAWVDKLRKPVGGNSEPEENRFKPVARACSGFYMRNMYSHYWLTAGHVLRNLDYAISNNDSERVIFKSNFMHLDRSGKTLATPFPINDSGYLYVDDPDTAADYGVVIVRPFYAISLEATGIRPIRRTGYATKKDVFDLYVLLGFPNETRNCTITSDENTHHIRHELDCPMLPIEPLDHVQAKNIVCDEHGYTGKVSKNRIYGKILTMEGDVGGRYMDLDSIVGMSGGPVFGLRFTETEIEYRLIGVQSSWYRKSKIISVCPIRPFADYLCAIMKKNIKQ